MKQARGGWFLREMMFESRKYAAGSRFNVCKGPEADCVQRLEAQ